MSQFTYFQAVQLKQVFYAHISSLDSGLSISGLGCALEEMGFFLAGGASSDILRGLIDEYDIETNSDSCIEWLGFLDLISQLDQGYTKLNEETVEALNHFSKLKPVDRNGKQADLSYADLEEILLSGPCEKYVEEKTVHNFICLVENYVHEHKCTLLDALHHIMLPSPLWHAPPPQKTNLATSLHCEICLNVLHANNLRQFVRPKPIGDGKVEGRLDPFLSVGMPGISDELYSTTVALNECEPEWMQDIRIPFVLPSSNSADIMQWISKQVLVFAFYDHQVYGVVPTSECLATATISLSTLVFHAISSMFTCHHLEMKPCNTLERLIDSSTDPLEAPYVDVLVDIPKVLSNVWHSHGQSCMPAMNAWHTEIVTCLRETAVHDTHLFELVRGGDPPHLVHHGQQSLNEQPERTLESFLDDETAEVVQNHYIPSDKLLQYMQAQASDQGLKFISQLVPRCSLLNDVNDVPLSMPNIDTPIRMSSADRSESGAPDDVQLRGKDYMLQTVVRRWERICKSVQNTFPRRFCHFVAMDEYEFFRMLPCFVQPVHQDVEQDPEKLLEIVNLLDTSSSYVETTPQTCDQLVHSMSFIMKSQRATPLEANILLCSLFLGIGLEAYVILGRHGGSYDVPRVVTLEEDFLTIWNPCSGVKISADEGHKMSTVDSVFSHENAWMNIQNRNQVTATNFDLSRSDCWWPVAPTNQVFNKSVYFPAVYACPNLNVLRPADTSRDEEDSELLEVDVQDSIKIYRHHHLFIESTPFNDRISQVLGKLISWEPISSEAKCIVKRSITSRTLGSNIWADPVPILVKRELGNNEYWYGKLFRFLSSSVSVIMSGLQASGILDCSVPGTSYTLAIRTESREFGLVQTFVYVGYMFPLSS